MLRQNLQSNIEGVLLKVNTESAQQRDPEREREREREREGEKGGERG